MPRIEHFIPVSSDIRVVEGRLSLACCMTCGVLQKLADVTWKAVVDRIYHNYDINHQGQGADPRIFNSIYGPGPRASILTDHLKRALPLRSTGRMLDIGCANGNILAMFADKFPLWSLYGLENSDAWRDMVSGISGVKGFFTSMEELKGQRFDLIVMSHLLEHISDPAAYLKRVRNLLSDSGSLFVAVPDIRQNPIDLLVMDHCTHFDELTLGDVLRRGGFHVQEIRADILGKELVAVVRVGRNHPPESRDFLMPAKDVAEKYLLLCEDLVRSACEHRERHPVFGVMGTSTAAAWIAGELGMQVDFFVDEDVQRIGGRAFGKPILSISQIPPGACVFIPMSSGTARTIIERACRSDVKFAYLPWNEIEGVASRVSGPPGEQH